MDKKIRTLLPLILLLVLLGAFSLRLFLKNGDVTYTTMGLDSTVYREYLFDSGRYQDSGFTSRALELMVLSEDMLMEESSIVQSGEPMQSVAVTKEEMAQGILEKRIFGEDVYELRPNNGHTIDTDYSIFENGILLFTASMDYGADGPILDWRVVDGGPAFTFRTSCSPKCGTDIFYGELISHKYDVKNPRYLFTYQGELGFVADDQNGDAIFFGGGFVTLVFDHIHTYNCCAVDEILPRVYSNGILLFYGQRGGQDYLTEVALTKNL